MQIFIDKECSWPCEYKIKYFENVANHRQDFSEMSFENYIIEKYGEDELEKAYRGMLNNIKLAEEPEITSIISNRYKILNINVEQEDLEENLEGIIDDVEKIVDYYKK